MTHFTASSTEQDSLPSHQLQTRHHNDGFSVLYHINDQLGEVRLGCDPMQVVVLTENGGDISHAFSLEPDESQDCWLWVMLSDQLTFTHFPDMARIRKLIDEHQRLWGQFWNTSHIQLDNETLVNFRQTCLYTIRCNASRWSIPPAYLPAYWEGRTFHDELYPFLGLLSSGHIDLAARIPSFRLNTLSIALQYGGGHGARYPWETLETGEEGGPYGAWMDERFHIGQFVETVWRYYQYTGDQDALMQLYPIMRDSARFFIYDVLIRDANGVLKTRRVTDFDEAIYPVDNGIFTLCSVIRTLETTAQAAQILNCDDNLRDHWLSLSAELHHALPVDEYYQVADGASHWHIAQMGSIYPFSFDVDSDTARKTMTALYDALKTEQNVKPGSAASYGDTHWMWVASMIATGFFYQGRREEGYKLLENILNSAGPFLSCNEQQRLGSTVDPQEKYWLPWFTTSAGAFVHAINSMFVQVDEHGTVLFKGVSSQTSNVQFSGLLASDGVRVSAQLENNQLQQLTVTSSKPQSWSFRLPESIAAISTLDGQPAEGDYVRITVQLDVGETVLLA